MKLLRIVDKSEPSNPLKVSVFRKEMRKTEPHKHNNYMELIFLSEGSGNHFIDQYRYEIQPPTIFLVRKEQVHYWDLTAEPEGFVLILKNEFLERSTDGALKLWLTRVSSHSCLQINNTVSIELLFRLLASETSFPVQEGLLKALLAKAMEVSVPESNNIPKSADLLSAYRELLCNNSELRNNVAHYAMLLHTTPQNLNTVCRKAVGLSASNVLSGFIIAEAKRLLLYTDNPVADIAYSLGFKDASHFVKYFKRYTQYTPAVFRRQ